MCVSGFLVVRMRGLILRDTFIPFNDRATTFGLKGVTALRIRTRTQSHRSVGCSGVPRLPSQGGPTTLGVKALWMYEGKQTDGLDKKRD